ncbi:MAG: hypothetical protein ACI9ES_001120 [Oceanospirillaceae bacterium]|jgi:hypothetical protein
MARQPAFICKNRYGTYYFRGIIPKHLRSLFRNQKEIRVTLSTDSRKRAIYLARSAKVEFDRMLYRRWSMKGDQAMEYEDTLMEDYRRGVAAANAKEPNFGYELHPEDACDLGQALREKEEAEYTAKLTRLHSDIQLPEVAPIPPVLPAATLLTASPSLPPPSRNPPEVNLAPTITEAAVIALNAEMKRNKKLGRRGRYFKACPKYFAFLFGDIKVNTITYKMILDFYYTLKDLPDSLFKAKVIFKDIKKLSDLSETILNDHNKVSHVTRKKYMHALKNILSEAKKLGHIEVNHAENFSFEIDLSEKPDNEKRDQFDRCELQQIFNRDFF